MGIGWSELPRSPVGMSRQELAEVLQATYPNASPNTIANNACQIWNFVNTIALVAASPARHASFVRRTATRVRSISRYT